MPASMGWIGCFRFAGWALAYSSQLHLARERIASAGGMPREPGNVYSVVAAHDEKEWP